MITRFQYSVKFICGKSDGKVAAVGNYWTAINVHNPGTARVEFQKKFAVALPGEKAGPLSQPPVRAVLGPDEALEIDREDIFRHSPLSADFLKGFVVIESDMELDVVVVYTAGATMDRSRRSIWNGSRHEGWKPLCRTSFPFPISKGISVEGKTGP